MSVSQTSISWTDSTWSPTRGCSRVNSDCDNCYAMRMARRLDQPGRPYDGLTRLRSVKTGGLTFDPAVASLGGDAGAGHRDGLVDEYRQVVDWSGVVRLVPSMLDQPLRWRKPRRIFVDSMSDLFHPGLKFEEIDLVFAVMALAPQHTFQILTKRPERMLHYLTQQNERAAISGIPYAWKMFRQLAGGTVLPRVVARAWLDRITVWPLPNVWLGVSAGHQAALDEFVPLLLRVPAAVRFLSLEPQTEEVDLDRGTGWLDGVYDPGPQHHPNCRGECERCPVDVREPTPSLDWVIQGGESGPGARAFDLAWARKTRDQCRAAAVPYFLKQVGSRPVAVVDDERDENGVPGSGRDMPVVLNDRGGKDVSEFPEDLRIQEMPEVRNG